MNKIYSYLFLILFLIASAKTASSQSNLEYFLGPRDNQDKTYQVVDVLSADTILLDTDKSVRLLGIKGPETRRRHKKIERDKFGFVIEEEPEPTSTVEERAVDFVSRFLTGQAVRLEFDIEKRTDKGQLMAYVYLAGDGTFVNAEIVRQGYADLQTRPPNVKHTEELREAYREAREEKRGIHSQ